jgi:glutathione S-transferase
VTIVLYDLCAADAARRFSPHCWKARIALAHKGLDYETVGVPFTRIKEVGDGFSPTVPVLDDDGRLVRDSFDIALYLEEAYPDRRSLFGGPGGAAMARFIEGWAGGALTPLISRMILLDIHNVLAPADQSYFRDSREKRFGKSLEDLQAGREDSRTAFRAALQPLRHVLERQPFIGGQGPLFCDYIVFGAFQWARVISAFPLLATDDPVAAWLDRCLDLHDGLARRMPAAA